MRFIFSSETQKSPRELKRGKRETRRHSSFLKSRLREKVDSRKRKPKWLQDTLKEVETVGAPKKQGRESRPSERFGSYITMVTDIIETEPSSYEEATT